MTGCGSAHAILQFFQITIFFFFFTTAERRSPALRLIPAWPDFWLGDRHAGHD